MDERTQTSRPDLTGPVVLVDAHNWLHRFFHAIPPQYKSGRNVAAVRALRDMVVRLRRSLSPAVLVAVFDGEGDCGGRRALLPSYKAGRPETPPELRGQIEAAALHLPRFGASTVRVANFEADDVIATLARSSHAAGHPVRVVSGDKDLCALVRDDGATIAVETRRDGAWATIREADVAARFGVAPAQLLDMLALAGDDTDGVPGVPGIGPKTAADLLRAHGSLAALLEAAPSMRERLARLLQQHRDAVLLARRVLEPVMVPLERIATSTLAPAAEVAA